MHDTTLSGVCGLVAAAYESGLSWYTAVRVRIDSRLAKYISAFVVTTTLLRDVKIRVWGAAMLRHSLDAHLHQLGHYHKTHAHQPQPIPLRNVYIIHQSPDFWSKKIK